jgi:anaphase-promoting complex subunit 3
MFNTLHAKDCNSGWVLNQIAKCYFEIPNYKQAAFIFEKIRTIEPYRTEGMELYSTTLWQLKQEIKLSYLAQQLTQYGKVSPHVWCVVGNCFSFQKEHDLALKFFQRAIQIDDRFTYAYTLSGHEYVSNEDFDKAIECYRHAIRTDDRHYNAWFGLGTIYYRQEKYDIAEYHFRKALNINSKSSVLHNYVGLVQSQRGEVSRPVGLVVCLCVCTDCSSVFFFLFSLLFLSCCYRTKVHWNHLKKQRNWDRAILKRNSLVLEYCVK